MWVFRKKTYTAAAVTYAILLAFLSCGWMLAQPTTAHAQSVSAVATTSTSAISIPATPLKTVADDAVDSAKCEGGGLSWIICLLINGMSHMSDLVINSFILPMLQTTPIDIGNTDTSIFRVWSSFRLIANILLVFALLVIVIGQALGSELASAYVAKKSLPRLLVAAILVNISIYLVAMAVDFTNVIGQGIGSLMIAPFKDSGNYVFHLNQGTSTGLSIATIVGSWWGIPLLTAAVALNGLQFFALMVLLPLVLAVIGVFATLIIRQGIIIFLIIVAPVAFVLYALPNTEQYFKKWWDMLLKTLLVYPIVVVVITISNILSVTITDTNNGSPVRQALASIVALVVMVIPLFLIPFAFQLAGGMIGGLAGKLSGWGKQGTEAIKGNINDPNSLRNRTKKNLAGSFNSARNDAIERHNKKYEGIDPNSKLAGARRRYRTRMAKSYNWGDLEHKISAANKAAGEVKDLKTGYGPDSSNRALWSTYNKETGMYHSIMDDNLRYTPQQFAAAKRLSGKTIADTQASLDYEVGKAQNDDQYQKLLAAAPGHMESLGFSESDITGADTGVGFKNAAKRLDMKQSSVSKGKDGKWKRKIKHAPLAQDAAENIGTFGLSNVKTSVIKALSESHDAASHALLRGTLGTDKNGVEVLSGTTDAGVEYEFKAADGRSATEIAAQTIDDVRRSADTLDAQIRGGGQTGEADGTPISGGGTGAPGRVNEEILKFVNARSTRANRPPKGP